jgi:NTE family protein
VLSAHPKPVSINLALQGGGAHGAFTWGVLDRLLQEPWLSFEGVSATSSGSLNALALAQGWMDGGREGARLCLSQLWEKVSAQADLVRWAFNIAPPGSRERIQGLSRYFTPKELNPLGINPIRNIAQRLFDFERLRLASPVRLFIAATRVRDGALEIFADDRIGIDALLASTCLPQFFAAVSLDGEEYWDGGWAGNPALDPLVYRCHSADVLSVLVQPLSRAQLPSNTRQIAERMVELSFSTTFLRELDSLRKAQNAFAGTLTFSWMGRRLKGLKLHLIDPGESLDSYNVKSKLNTRLSFLQELRDLGSSCAEQWLGAQAMHLGKRSTLAP